MNLAKKQSNSNIVLSTFCLFDRRFEPDLNYTNLTHLRLCEMKISNVDNILELM